MKHRELVELHVYQFIGPLPIFQFLEANAHLDELLEQRLVRHNDLVTRFYAM